MSKSDVAPIERSKVRVQMVIILGVVIFQSGMALNIVLYSHGFSNKINQRSNI